MSNYLRVHPRNVKHLGATSCSLCPVRDAKHLQESQNRSLPVGPLWTHMQLTKKEPSEKRKYKNRNLDPAFPHYESRNRQSLGQKPVDNSFFLESELAEHASVRIDNRRNACVGGAHHRQTLLDCAKLSLMEVLIGTGAAAEPGVVGHVEKPARPLRFIHDLVGKNDLIADERPRRRSAGDRKQARTCAGAEASAHAGHLEDAETSP